MADNLQRKKILLVTYYFPPFNNISSLRTLSFARYLGKSGYDVTVLTANHTALSGQEFDVSKEPFRLAAILSARSRQAVVTDQDEAQRPGWPRRFKAWLLGNLFSFIDRWYFDAVKEAFSLMAEQGFDVVISSHSPISCHCIARQLKLRFPGIKWIADYRDLWSYNHFGITPKFPFSVLQRYLEQRINRPADYLTTVSVPLKETLDAHYHKDAVVIENGFFPDDYEAGKDENVKFSARYTFSYTGILYMEKYDVTPFFRAMAEFIDDGAMAAEDGEIRFYGDNSFMLRDIVGATDLPVDFVRLLPRIPRRQALAVQRQSTALLFLGYESPETKGVLTGKLFEYMISGRPIIAVGITEDNLAGSLIRESNTGYVCGNDVGKIKDALGRIIGGEQLEPDWEFINQFRRDKLVDRLVEIIEQ